MATNKAKQLGVVLERESQRKLCQNHCHPNVTVGISKAAPSEEQHQRLYTVWGGGNDH